MGSATSCLSGGNSNEGQQPFVRRTVSMSELTRPLTKKLSNLKILSRISTTDSNDDDDDDDGTSQEATAIMKAEGKRGLNKNTPEGNITDEGTADTSQAIIEQITSSETDDPQPVLSVQDRITAFEREISKSLRLSVAKPITTSASHHEHDTSSVKDKIAKFNAMHQSASKDPKAEVKNGLRDPLVVKKSGKFLATMAVFEKTTRKATTGGTPGSLRLILESETSSEEGSEVKKNLASGGSSPRRVTDFLSA